MKLTLVGGGGFRVPQVFEALAGGDARARVSELCLYDTSPTRLAVMYEVLRQLADRTALPPKVSIEPELDTALKGADFVFSAMRVGGTAGRIADERVALSLGVLGQETVGPGGLAYALRTLPDARRLAERVAAVAPDAWIINFTNPAGMITEAMLAVPGVRAVGICDTPIGLMRRAVDAVGVCGGSVEFDYAGLNHLGWLRSLKIDGVERLPGLLEDDERLARLEEAQLIGHEWIRALGALPNEYLYYYYYQREAEERIQAAEETRGEYLQRQQAEFYRSAHSHPEGALELWNMTRRQRESTYMAESRPGSGDRQESDVEGGGYQNVALELMAGLVSGTQQKMILNVANRGTVPGLPDDAVIEVGCTVGPDQIVPGEIGPVVGESLALLQQVKSAEQLILQASLHRDPVLAWRAFAAHPMVDSVAVARRLLQAYREAIPGVDAAFR